MRIGDIWPYGILTPGCISPSFSYAAPVQVRRAFCSPALQAPESDHVVGTTCGRRGRNVRRFTSGEENDATGHKVLTLLNRKVTAQLEVNSSC